MKIVSVVGARPQFVKLAAVSDALKSHDDVVHVIVHTGQHYDSAMSDVFFEHLVIPSPDVHLGVGSGTHGVQTGAMLAGLDVIFDEHRPDWALVYGDTNSTLAAALAAVKLHVPVAHLEAGLRSFNRRMPEEHNRVLTDHAADLLLAPTALAMRHLETEGLLHRAVNVGDVMTDVCFRTRDAVESAPLVLPASMETCDRYVVATVHRPDNTDDEDRLNAVVNALRELPLPVLLVAHPRLSVRAASFGIELSGGSLNRTRPLAYHEMVRAVMGCSGVVTDSGGLQKEAFLLGKPCTTIRSETEWEETLVDDWNILDPGLARLPESAARTAPAAAQSQPYGDGNAADRVVAVLKAGEAGGASCSRV